MMQFMHSHTLYTCSTESHLFGNCIILVKLSFDKVHVLNLYVKIIASVC